MDQESIIRKYKLNELSDILDAIEDDIAQAIIEKKIMEQRDYSNFLLNVLGKSIVTFRECICLCENGFPDGALSLARNIYEQFIHTLYMESKIEADFELLLQKYFDDHTVKRAKALRFEAEKINHDQNAVKMYEEQRNRIRNKYNIKELKDYWWSGCQSFGDMCDIVAKHSKAEENITRCMHFFYLRACTSLHAGCLGNRLRIGSYFQGIDMGPWDSGQEDSLFLAIMSLLRIVQFTYKNIGISENENIDGIYKLAIYYSEMVFEV